MYQSNEIKTIEYWELVWWDREKDEEFVHSVTGTIVGEMFQNRPRLEKRRIQRIQGKQVHVCGGELEMLEKECGPFQVWFRCQMCGKEFLAEV